MLICTLGLVNGRFRNFSPVVAHPVLDGESESPGPATAERRDFVGKSGLQAASRPPASLTILRAVLGCPIDPLGQADLASQPLGAKGGRATYSGPDSVDSGS